MNNKLIAIMAVVIIVIAGCSVLIISGNDSDDERIDTSEVAAVYGNANNDYAVDKLDVELLREMADGKKVWNKSTQPLADADQDGKITNADADLVQNIIDKKNCQVYYLNYFGDAQKLNYPLDTSRIAVTYWQQAEEMGILGLWDNVVLANASVDGRDNLYDLSNVTFMGNSATSTVDSEQVQLILQKDVTLIISSAYEDMQTYFEPLESQGIQTVYLYHAGDYCISTLLTMGVLCDKVEQAEKFLLYWTDLAEAIDKRVPSSDRPSVVIVMNHKDEDNYIKSYGGIFTSVNSPAGEWELISKLADVYTTEAVGRKSAGRNYYSIDWFIQNPFDYMVVMGSGTGATNQAEYDAWFETISAKYYAQTQEYKNGNILGISYSFGGFSGYSLMPILAWMLYPDAFTYEEALELRQYYYDNFVPLKPDCTTIPLYYLGSGYDASYL